MIVEQTASSCTFFVRIMQIRKVNEKGLGREHRALQNLEEERDCSQSNCDIPVHFIIR